MLTRRFSGSIGAAFIAVAILSALVITTVGHGPVPAPEAMLIGEENAVGGGACCQTNGACVIVPNASICFGLYQGNGSSCADCEGACCLANDSCTLDVQFDCEGSFLGIGTDCSPNPCVGACCFADGACLVRNEGDCGDEDGAYEGDGTTCGSTDCPQPTGACCLPAGTCVIVEQTMCTNNSGIYEGDDAPCTPTLCPVPTGACCLPNGGCLSLTSNDCVIAAGAFQGAASACAQAKCPVSCPTDIDGNGDTGFNDLLMVISAWGPCP